jgi:DNA replication protein DnaC
VGHRWKLREWTLATFPADDPAGKAALEAIEPWLWAHIGHRIFNGELRKIDERNPDPDMVGDHPIWSSDEYVSHVNAEGKPNLYLYGSVGSGKTGLAWSLLREKVWRDVDAWEERDTQPAWVNVVELFADARAAISSGQPSPIRALYNSTPLVLDDLGAERPTDWARDEIAALVLHRHDRDLPTIVTSNYAPSALAQRLGHDDRVIGQRIVSRLTENCIRHKLDRADLRARRAA